MTAWVEAQTGTQNTERSPPDVSSLGMQAGMEYRPDELRTLSVVKSLPPLPELHAGQGNLRTHPALYTHRQSRRCAPCDDKTTGPVDEEMGN